MSYPAYFVFVSNLVPAALAGTLAWYLNRSSLRARLRSGRPLASSLGVVVLPLSSWKTAVGGGWSFFQRTAATGDVLFTRGTRGRRDHGKWAAGSSIGEVQAWLAARGQTLTGHPSILEATLGGWIASGSHGSGGTLWKKCLGRVTVRDQATGQVLEDVQASDYFADDKTVGEQRRYILEEVEVLPVENVVCELTFRELRGDDEVQAHFLAPPSYLRLMLVGARGVASLVWGPCAECGDDAQEKTTLDTWRLWWHADVASLSKDGAFLWKLPDGVVTQRMRLGEANHFTPTPPLLWTSLGMQFTNFEVFLQLPDIPPSLLWSLCRSIQDMFAHRMRGRCEVRYGASGKLFLDFVVHNASFRPPVVFETIASVVGVGTPLWLHKGKAQVPTAPMTRMPQGV